jgi:hypothetical protein
VAAVPAFGRIHRHIGALQEYRRVARIVREESNSDTAPSVNRTALDDDWLPQRRKHPLRDRLGFGQSGTR